MPPFPSLMSNALYGVPRADILLGEADVLAHTPDVMSAHKTCSGLDLPGGIKERTLYKVLNFEAVKYKTADAFINLVNDIRSQRGLAPADKETEIVGAEWFVEHLQTLLDLHKALRVELSRVTYLEPEFIEQMTHKRRVPHVIADHVLKGLEASARTLDLPWDRGSCYLSNDVPTGRSRKELQIVTRIFRNRFVRDPSQMPDIPAP
ncbi:MAG: hypothetical protein ACFB6R_08250 [Alphaproteobacteria bacterium]